jgi:mevalonate kinase
MPFPSKILLFGEYVVLLHAKALAIPFPHFFAQLKLDPARSTFEEKGDKFSNLMIGNFYRYIRETIGNKNFRERFDTDSFKSDIDNGLYFESNIPIGYGIGSSGALTAAVYDKYVRKHDDTGMLADYTAEIRKDMAYMESFFHGNSSGIDPLVSYFKKPILFDEGEITILNQSVYPANLYSVFLIDTGAARKTGDLVQHFMSNCKEIDYMASVQRMISYNNTCIGAILEDNAERFIQHLPELSIVQHALFRSIIASSLLTFWQQGFQSGHYFVKLCGSGGGGFLLAFVKNEEVFLSAAQQFQLSVLKYQSFIG